MRKILSCMVTWTYWLGGLEILLEMRYSYLQDADLTFCMGIVKITEMFVLLTHGQKNRRVKTMSNKFSKRQVSQNMLLEIMGFVKKAKKKERE